MADEQVQAQAQSSIEVQPSAPAEKEKKRDEIHDMTTLHERTIAALSYLGPMAIVPFYLKKESEFCRFHGKQGMVLAIAFFVAKIISVIDFVFDLFLILQVSLFFYMGFKAISGKWHKLPIVYKWSYELEKALTLKTKEEELAEMKLAPNEVNSNQEQGVTAAEPSSDQFNQ
jgi:uncharacterized membrane protein